MTSENNQFDKMNNAKLGGKALAKGDDQFQDAFDEEDINLFEKIAEKNDNIKNTTDGGRS